MNQHRKPDPWRGLDWNDFFLMLGLWTGFVIGLFGLAWAIRIVIGWLP